MVNCLHRFSSNLVKGVLAGFLTLVFVGFGALGLPAQAVAAPAGTLTETMDLKISEAAQEFVSSILGEYEDALKDSFGATLKPLKSVTKDLTKQLSKIAVSPTPDTTLLAPQLTASQTALETAAAAFKTLVDDTNTFKQTLEATPTQLKEALDAQLSPKFTDLQAAFDQVSSALATLATDTATIEGGDVTAAVGKLTEDSTLLAQAMEMAKVAISSFGD